MEKKKVIKSLENLSPEHKSLLKAQYPDGFEEDLIRLQTPKKEPRFVVPLETDDTTILVKIAMSRNSEGEFDIEPEIEEEFQGDEEDTIESAEASYDPDFDE